MAATKRRPAIIVAGLLLGLLAVYLQGVQGEEELEKVPSEDQCRPYIEKALKDLGTGSEEEEEEERLSLDAGGNGAEEQKEKDDDDDNDNHDYGAAEHEVDKHKLGADARIDLEDDDQQSKSREKRSVSNEETEEEEEEESGEKKVDLTDEQREIICEDMDASLRILDESKEGEEAAAAAAAAGNVVIEDKASIKEDAENGEQKQDDDDDNYDDDDDKSEEANTSEQVPSESAEQDDAGEEVAFDGAAAVAKEVIADDSGGGGGESNQDDGDSKEEAAAATAAEDEDEKSVEEEEIVVLTEEEEEATIPSEPEIVAVDESEETTAAEGGESSKEEERDGEGGGEDEEEEEEAGESASPEEEELIMEIEVPEILRPRDHIGQLLKLDEENEEKERAVEKIAEIVLRDLKRLYDNAIKPLETLYKYRDLSNRHFGDPEIFSKPLVLFMGPWSGGKSSIINYLLDIEYKPTTLRTGAEPSPAYFNILMHGEEEEVLDGTQLAADWTFSGLQKFGQGLLDRLKGYKLNSKLLEKVNIVEIPGILEIRKQVQRLFPFNDACQWFIDRADIIFLVYDPSKLDVGPETEAILDQLKGREYQTRIILNKADQVKPEELMRVQGALIWNISPLMSSAEPPIMYSASLWSIPYEAGAPTRLLYAQERAFLRDLRSAIDKRVEHKIASARRFAVRVRNHAKMVDCYLTTYYNHKSFFAKKKDVADRIVESPQDFHIYEGLSTLTNISRYDLPDPDVYRDFFRLNNLYEFPLLSSTCTYFRGCPINRLDVAIAYDLPELVGKYKKSMHVEEALAAAEAPQAQAQKAQKSEASKPSLS